MTTLNIVAHPDDDILFLGSDIAEDLERGESAHILYLTMGDDGGDEIAVTKHRWALDEVYQLTMGFPLMLGIPSNSFRNGDIEGSLYRMWHNHEHTVETPFGRLSHDALLAYLTGCVTHSISLVRIQDPECEPNLYADSPHGDHVDHIYGAKFAQEACKAFPHIPVYAYTSYPIRFMPPNLNAHQIELKTKMWRAYQSVDTSVAGEQWDLAMSRCYKRRIQ